MVVQPDAEAFALCNGNVGTGVIAEQSVPATGGSFSVSAAVTEPEGTYAVCGYLSATGHGASVPLAASPSAAVVTVAPQPCPSGTAQPLLLTAPAKLAYGQRGVVGVNERIASVKFASVVSRFSQAAARAGRFA